MKRVTVGMLYPPLKDFIREIKGTCVTYQMPLKQWRGMSRGGMFSNYWSRVGGKCKMKTLYACDTESGETMAVIQITVLKPVPPRKKRGRKKDAE